MKKTICTILIGLALVRSSAEAQRPQPEGQTRQNHSDPYYKYIKNLPKTDKVELLAVMGIPFEEFGKFDCKDPKIVCGSPYTSPARVLTSTMLAKANAEKLALLWRKLEPGNSAGCFTPAYVIRYFFEEKPILETVVCFHCCNASLPNTGLVGLCGDGKAMKEFKEMVMTLLPYPEVEKK